MRLRYILNQIGGVIIDMSKTVPLVIYKDGERIVIGEASLVLGSGTDIVVDARIDPVHAGILATPNVAMSIGSETKAL